MVKNGLESDNYCGWIDKGITIDNKLNYIISNFVIGTPAFDCSSKGRDLYSFYGIKTGAEFQRFSSELLGAHEVITCEDYNSLKQAVMSDPKKNFSDNLPQTVKEWFCFFTGKPTDGKLYKAINKQQNGNQALPTWTADDKKAVVKVEMLFRHIRNSFAHGRFTYIEKNKERYYILQDENNNCISARMIVKQSTLKKWIEILDEKRLQYISGKNV